MKKILPPALFYFGVVIAAAGFLTDKAENIPGVLRLLAPSYARAANGLDTLQPTGTLGPGQSGFFELESFFWREADAKGARAQLAFQQVRRFERKTAMIAFGEAHAGEVVPVDVQLTSTSVKWDMAGLRERAERLKRSSLLGSSTIIFVLGIVSTIVGRLLEEREKKPNEPLQPTSGAGALNQPRG